jgi:hypothetical protein
VGLVLHRGVRDSAQSSRESCSRKRVWTVCVCVCVDWAGAWNCVDYLFNCSSREQNSTRSARACLLSCSLAALLPSLVRSTSPRLHPPHALCTSLCPPSSPRVASCMRVSHDAAVKGHSMAWRPSPGNLRLFPRPSFPAPSTLETFEYLVRAWFSN